MKRVFNVRGLSYVTVQCGARIFVWYDRSGVSCCLTFGSRRAVCAFRSDIWMSSLYDTFAAVVLLSKDVADQGQVLVKVSEGKATGSIVDPSTVLMSR